MCNTILNLIASTYPCILVLALLTRQVATLSSQAPAHNQILARHLLSSTPQPGVGMASHGGRHGCLTLLIPSLRPYFSFPKVQVKCLSFPPWMGPASDIHHDLGPYGHLQFRLWAFSAAFFPPLTQQITPVPHTLWPSRVLFFLSEKLHEEFLGLLPPGLRLLRHGPHCIGKAASPIGPSRNGGSLRSELTSFSRTSSCLAPSRTHARTGWRNS